MTKKVSQQELDRALGVFAGGQPWNFTAKDLANLPRKGSIRVTPDEVTMLAKAPERDYSRPLLSNMRPEDYTEGGEPLVFFYDKDEEQWALHLLVEYRGSKTFESSPVA